MYMHMVYIDGRRERGEEDGRREREGEEERDLTSIALLAISVVSTYHCGLMSGSTMSFDLLQTGTTIGFSFVSRYRPFSFNASRTAVRAWNRFIP